MAIYNRDMEYHLTREDVSTLVGNASFPREDIKVVGKIAKEQLAKECYAKNQQDVAEGRVIASSPDFGARMYENFDKASCEESRLIRALSDEARSQIRVLKTAQGVKDTIDYR